MLRISLLFIPTRIRLTLCNSLRLFYDSRSKHDTIYAPITKISQAKGSPLGAIRVSGSKTNYVLTQFIRYQLSQANSEINLNTQNRTLKPRHATLAKIVEPKTDELIDIGLVLWFPAPHSYTGEDVCEFHLHGSSAIMTKMLSSLGTISGLRPAEPGEFTRRAVLNHKMSLPQAESLPDLIASQTDYQRKLALKGLDNSTCDKYQYWIDDLIGILAHLEASIDFGEDELIGERLVVNNCIDKIQRLSKDIQNHLNIGYKCKQFIQDGFRVAILGRPNAGKSTLMNLLCQSDKSIVSDLSGTTRDVVEHAFDFGGHSIKLCDTAGLKNIDSLPTKPENLIEQHASVEREGVRRAIEAAKNADLIIYLYDASNLSDCHDNHLDTLTKELDDLSRDLDCENAHKAIHLVLNKIDLNERLSGKQIEFERTLRSKCDNITSLSCKTHENYNNFIVELTTLMNKFVSLECDRNLASKNFEYVTERHLTLLQIAQRHLVKASKLDLDTIDEMAQHVRESLDYLSRIVGSVSNEQVFDVIFRDFCIGK